MRRRTYTIQSIINEQIQKFQTDLINKYTDNIHINSEIYDQIINKNYHFTELCLNKLDQFLSHWNGVDTSHTKKKLSTFREYFIIGRAWFDQRKKEILATDLWINVLDIIISVSKLIGEYFIKERLKNGVQRAILLQVVFQHIPFKSSSVQLILDTLQI